MQKISTSDLNTRKKVEIDGHPYIVRRFGAGEELDLNRMFRRVAVLEPKLTDKTATPEEEIEAEDLTIKMLEMFTLCFDDGGDGSKSKALVISLNQVELRLLFKQIFGDESGKPEAS